jgi:hypothetical protein
MPETSLPPKKSDHTIVAQAPDAVIAARKFTSSADGRVYLVFRHPRPSGSNYSYYVLVGIDEHHYEEVEVEASSRQYLGEPREKEGKEFEWWGIWPEPRF